MGRKIYKINKLGGVCFSDGAMGENSLSYVKNMISEDGILKKRKGWSVLYNFRSKGHSPLPINGIYEYKGDNKSCIIVHAGSSLFECDYTLTSIREIKTGSGITLKNERSTGQMYENQLWINGGDNIVIYDGEGVYTAKEHPLAYVPTTRVGITSGGIGQKHEGANLLTEKRINTLRGEKAEGDEACFFLDGRVQYKKPFRLRVAVRVKKTWEISDELSTDYIGTDSQGQEVSALVSVDFYIQSLEEGTVYYSSAIKDEAGNDIAVNKLLGIRVVGANKLCLDFDCPTYQRDKDNIEAEFYNEGQGTYLDRADAFATYTSKTGESSLLVFYKNKMSYSYGEEKKFYFPSESVVSIGQETEKNVSALPMTDGYLAVYKKNSFYRLKLGTQGWEVFPSADSIGCINSLCAVRLGYDCLVFNNEGIFGVKDLENPEYITTRLYNRAKRIQGELDRYSSVEKSSACACVHNGMYYLFIGEKAYITGLEHATDKSDEFGYNWWVFDSCPCSFAASINGRMYMGRENGEIAVFDTGYKDKRIYTLTENEWEFVFNNSFPYTVASFSSQISVKEGDRVYLSPHAVYSCIAQYNARTKAMCVPWEVFFNGDGSTLLYEGMEILVKDNDGYIIYEGPIIKTNPDDLSIEIGSVSLYKDTELQVYLKKDEAQEYVLAKEGTYFTLVMNGAPIRLYDTDIERVYIRTQRSVECEICTFSTDLGEYRNKNLYAIIFIPSSETNCKVKIGYRTRKNSFSKEVNVFSYMDFDRIDFGNMGFDSGIKKSIKINCFERGFDFIKITASSVEGEGLGIESIALLYEENQEGVK